MATHKYPQMTEREVIDEIKNLEQGQPVAFAVERQNRYKLQFSYEVGSVAPDSTVDVQGPEGSQWRFVINDGHSRLRFRSPSSGWQNAGILDYVEGRG
ncbi:hypothetical protein ACLI4Q_16245 [Natrialbaceae archaeon A-CW1-1]